jgi:hypothetical protein
MTRHPLLRVPETPKCSIDRVVRHRTRQREQLREDILPEASGGLQLAQDRDGLASEGVNVQLTHLMRSAGMRHSAPSRSNKISAIKTAYERFRLEKGDLPAAGTGELT